MANPHSQFLSRQDKDNMDLHFNNLRLGDSSAQGAVCRHNLSQGYEDNEWVVPMHNEGWSTNPHPTTMHTRSTSDYSHTTSSSMPEHFNLYDRRRSVPTIQYQFQHGTQSQQVMGYVGSGPLQGYPPMVGSQYLTQHSSPDPYLTSSTIPTTSGGPIPGPHSPSPPWYTPQPSPEPSHQLGPGFQSGTPFPQQTNQGHFPLPDAGHGGNGRGVVNRASRSNSRTHPYHRDAWQTSPTQDNRHSARSPDNLSSMTSRTRVTFDGSDSATSPGTDSDPHRSLPNTPGYTNGSMREEFEAVMKEDHRKEKQMLKKREDRKGEKGQFQRVTDILGLEKPTKADVLEKAIEQLGGRAPTRRHEPTQALQGREQKRSERAKQVSAARNDLTRLFDEVAHCMGYTTQSVPKREILLKDVADELERRMTARTRFPGSRGGAGPGGHHWMA